MFVIVGMIVVFSAVIGGYLLEHGNLSVLFQPVELLIIGGAAIGAFMISNPLKIIKATLGAVKGIFSGESYSKQDYVDALMLLNGVFYKIRQQGLVSIESDVDAPGESVLFNKYPKILKNHRAVLLIADTLRIVMTTTIATYELEALIDTELETYQEEILSPSKAINFVADSLPGLGIVAAVLGIVLTMAKMKESPEVLGQSVGAAMLGTFLGVLLCYGFVGPMGKNLEHSAGERVQYLNVLKVALISFLGGSAPKVAVEFGRRVIPENVQPSFAEMEEALRRRK
ncbi:MAG: flagellar motor stator protein MotA [Syntrophobacterales bacterium CG_4_8_14_3_um_filter_58_8]|nr:MAG: flagellar motor stator protein MotA [Syntrophaceae bacterium CG2_30_58_14]PIV05364.1 MAG: flagellar motor stator protein MotA [Syntrophobacterales bacterium CG03_land_8_20_14_0_80_58_14]PJC71922.1 MAG: flagellar motor stator protein MotA [Syntrophobacterales bacterium CG_4_8_14_3_um_filter_58_8]